MAEKGQAVGQTTPEALDAENAPRKSKKKKLIVFGFLAMVITGECMLAAMYLPSEEDVAPVDDITLVEQQLNTAPQTPTDVAIDLDESRLVEVDLKTFSVTSFQPDSNTTLHVDCHLYAAVAPEEQSEFEDAYMKYENRIRDGILRIFRAAESTDYADSGLGLIKRSITEKVNEIVGKPLVRSVIVSDFDFYEQ